jgi:membrane associated rhomboid family serine protease
VSTLQTRRRRGTGAGEAFVAMVAMLALLWILEALDQASGNRLDGYGIRPRTDDGLWHVFTAPLMHGGWAHLVGNSLPFLVLGFLVLLTGWAAWAGTTLASVVGSGALVWTLAPPHSITLGASGVVFGWLTYLIVRAFFSRSAGQIALAVVVFLLYGGILWGILPGTPGVSWQGHLGGALGGALAAWWLHRRRTPLPARLPRY